MGILVPEDRPLNPLDQAERRVVQKLLSGLRDSWLIVPRVDIVSERRPYEIDVLAISERFGLLAIEVKGGPAEVRQGVWSRRGKALKSPTRQANDAAYALRTLLRDRSSLLEPIHVQHAVALPDVASVSGDLGSGVTRQHLLLAPDLEEPDDRFHDLMVSYPQNRPLDADQVREVLEVVAPDVDFAWDPDARARHARTMLQRISTEQTRALATLDQNRRVLVTGRAGSGKTRLALAWTERALARGERVMLTCFNRPLSEWLEEMAPDHENLTVGTVQRNVMHLPGLPGLEVPRGVSPDWWETEPFRHLEQNLGQVGIRFDTIIVDEAQDLDPAWLLTLEKLFRPGGGERFLMVADERQHVFQRGFVIPGAGGNVVRADLTVNCRNTRQIAELLRSFGGAPSAPGVPDGPPVRLEEGAGMDDTVEKVGRLLNDLVVTAHVDPANVMVVTGHTALRDRIRDEDPGGWGCASWADRFSGEIVCETIHRAKGLERDAVILATVDDDLEDHLLYVGMSRAVSRLVVIGPETLSDRLRAKARLRSREEVEDG
jgi:hypothetical protein